MKNTTVAIKPIPFFAWAISTVNKLRKAIGIGALLLAALAVGNLEPASWPERWKADTLASLFAEKQTQRAILAFIQAGVSLLLAFMTPKPELPGKFHVGEEVSAARLDIARRSCRHIKNLVIVLFVLWAGYYTIQGFSLLLGPDSVDRVFLITLSALTSVVLFWLYLEMGEITIDHSPTISRFTSISTYMLSAAGVYGILIFVAWFGYAKHSDKTVDIVDMAVAALSGIGLCFVVGRFADKYINPGPITLFLLYLYAVLQLGGAMIAKDPTFHLVVTTLALPLKIVLWLVCVWAFTTGVLGEYVVEVRILIERVDEERAAIDEPITPDPIGDMIKTS